MCLVNWTRYNDRKESTRTHRRRIETAIRSRYLEVSNFFFLPFNLFAVTSLTLTLSQHLRFHSLWLLFILFKYCICRSTLVWMMMVQQHFQLEFWCSVWLGLHELNIVYTDSSHQYQHHECTLEAQKWGATFIEMK